MIKLTTMKKISSRFPLLGGILLFAIFLSGCATVLHLPVVPSEKEISQELAESSWAQVLSHFVDLKGRVNFKNLGSNPLSLHRYVRFIAQSSPMKHPEKFPTHEERLAYYLNSYNALAMYGILSTGFPRDFEKFWDRASFFKFTVFNIGGEDISLYDYENKIIRPLSDPRVHFALNCMVKGCPRLPQTPFFAEDIHPILTTLSEEFVNHPRHVQVLDSARLVRISEIIKFYTEDFVNAQSSPSLIAYINRYRKVEIPENYNVEFIPYDWTVNNQ